MTISIGRHIESIEPYKPGKPLEELERELGIKDAIKLASNENPLGPSKKALAALKKGSLDLHRYPEGSGRRLREAIGQKHKLKAEQVILGNGSDEIMDLAAKTFLEPGDEAILGDQTFAIYRISVTAHHGISVRVPLRDGRFDLEAMAARLTPLTRLVFICNPNNPTGTMITRRELDGLLKHLSPNALVVMDEAYAEYADDPEFPNTVEDVRRGAPVLVLRTFSKMYGLAGLRIGYGLSTPEVIESMNRVRLPFNTNSLAQAAALAALTDEAHVARSLRVNREGRRYLSESFKALDLRFLPSQANFVYVDTGRNGVAVYARLLKKGVIVRHIQGSWLRISIGRPAENRRFVKALAEVLKNKKGKDAV
ncbi:MAG TPA: histidinol-phosphate transaminase [Nitrospiria bacterium]|nr:histidinol-phosphate transaminase [Nitrospiria bacterium]